MFTGMFLHLKVKIKFVLIVLICIEQSEEVYANIITYINMCNPLEVSFSLKTSNR